MMYSSKMVCCLKANGKVLREHKDTVYVPFGTEYSVLLKNLNSVRALAKIEIDGVDVSEGERLVIDSNREFELTRFIKNGNLKSGNRFKFIERTAGVESHRGVRMEDGIIRVEFQFERVIPAYLPPSHTLLRNDKLYYKDPTWYGLVGGTTAGTDASHIVKGATSSVLRSYASQNEPMYLSNAAVASSFTAQNMAATSVNDAGITVPGSKSDQQFHTVSDFPVESDKYVMVLKLLGETDAGKLVTAPVTVKSKPKCITCGRLNKSGSKFCTDCGTALEII